MSRGNVILNDETLNFTNDVIQWEEAKVSGR